MKRNFLVICLLSGATLSASAQNQASEKALQAAYSAVRDSGWSPVTTAFAAEVAAPRGVLVDNDGTHAPCPSNRPFSGEWPSNLRCYYDAAGNLHHWAALHEVTAHIDSFWFEGKTKTQERTIVGYAALLLKQRQYNEWVQQNPQFKTYASDRRSDFGQHGGSWGAPASLPETGRLTMGTLLIPYYKSLHSYRELYAIFILNCSAAEGGRGAPEHPCAKSRRIDSGSEWIPNYPNEEMAEWGRALEGLEQARLRLYERVAALGIIGKKAVWDPLDCYGAPDRRDCSIEALPPAEVAALDSLTRDIAARIQRISEIEQIRADGIVPITPVEWIAIAGDSPNMNSFELSKTLVTVEQYTECVLNGRCSEPGTKHGDPECNWGKIDRALSPINCVSWHQANEYARFQGARLPTAAEFEYSATNGRRTRYPWGDTFGCNTSIPGLFSSGKVSESDNRLYYSSYTRPVCSVPSSNTSHGLCDMRMNGFGQWVEGIAAERPQVVGKVETEGNDCNPGPRQIRLKISGLIDHSTSAQNYGDVGFRLARNSR